MSTKGEEDDKKVSRPQEQQLVVGDGRNDLWGECDFLKLNSGEKLLIF